MLVASIVWQVLRQKVTVFKNRQFIKETMEKRRIERGREEREKWRQKRDA